MILAALWTICILWTIYVLLQTITIINFNRAMGNLDAIDDFNFTNFQLLLLSQGGFKPLVGEAVVPKFTITHYESL